MNDTDGLLAEAQVEGDDNQQQAEDSAISHLETEAAPQEAAETQEVERPEWLPEKFNSGEDLANAYGELQKKFSQGKHKAPENYDTSIFDEAGIGDDDPLYNAYSEWAKENGISQDAFEQLAGTFIQMAQSENQQAEVSYQEEYQKLGPNADAAIKSMTDWASGLVRKGVWSNDDFEEFKIMGGTAQGLRALQKIRSYYGDKTVPTNVSPTTDAPSKEDLQAMIADPEYQTNPAFRAKVERMFENVYGNEEYSTI